MLKVNINIAGRSYPLTVNANEERAVREAGKEINRLVQEFEQKYAVSDKQDAIAMAALQLTSKYNLLKESGEGVSKEINERIVQLNEFIDRELENIT